MNPKQVLVLIIGTLIGAAAGWAFVSAFGPGGIVLTLFVGVLIGIGTRHIAENV